MGHGKEGTRLPEEAKLGSQLALEMHYKMLIRVFVLMLLEKAER